MLVLTHVPKLIKYYIHSPARPRSVVIIPGPVKCAYVIYGTFVRCTALAVRNPCCYKQPISLKSAAIKTVLSVYNIHFSIPDHIPCHKLKLRVYRIKVMLIVYIRAVSMVFSECSLCIRVGYGKKTHEWVNVKFIEMNLVNT